MFFVLSLLNFSSNSILSLLYMLYKIFCYLFCPLSSELFFQFYPKIVMKCSLSVNSLIFPSLTFNTSQYSRCFILATTILWNDHSSMIVKAVELK